MTSDDLQYLNKYTTPPEARLTPRNIIVVGVGGGGNNAVNHMCRQGIDNVSFVVINTDSQALKNSIVPNKLLIGPTVTRGRGAGNDPALARQAAEESAGDIAELFSDDNLDMVFVTAGMGGGTGTGAGPVVARIAKERGLLTIGIVTIPFMHEGMKKIQKAINGANEMSKYVDAIMIVNNERLIEIYPDFDFEDSFAKADDVLSTAASSIAEIVTLNGYINLDFNDVNTTLRDGGTAIISVGYGEGENRVAKAIKDALESPLLRDTDVYTSKHILFNLYYSRTGQSRFKTSEAKQLHDFIRSVESDVDVIWGITYDETLGDKVKFTILASGFDVTLNEGTTIKVNAPAPDTSGSGVDIPTIAQYYDRDKLEALEREKETQNYIILSADTIDDDAAIEKFEKVPTFQRSRRHAPAIATPTTDGTTAPSANAITFGDFD